MNNQLNLYEKPKAIGNLRRQYDASFTAAYNILNNEQRAAVDQIDGPVMVIAGPGTGKTQILSVRIGKILRETQTAPHNILCLTYTEAATAAMRKRLVEIIGPEGHQVHIFTFHGFCNQVIQENLGIFGAFRQLEPLSELEEIDIFRQIVDDLPDNHTLKRFKKDRYYESRRMKSLFQMMKKENLSPEQMHRKLVAFLEDQKMNDEFYAKRKTTNGSGKTYEVGEFRDDKFQKFADKYRDLEAAIPLYEAYAVALEAKERYDFNDMILWVLREFDNNPDLLAEYQERYQYFLVDEYQDTNGAQNGILKKLTEFWKEQSNVFVVGDDDQAIFKFQGANIYGIKEFQERYHPKMIVLQNNYRSTQPILDGASHLINLNTERLTNLIEGALPKNLISNKENQTTTLKLYAYESEAHEYAALAEKLKDLHEKKTISLNEVAVIYRNHRQIEKLSTVMNKKGIPFSVKRKMNIMDMPLIKNIVNILRYLQEEYTLPHSAEGRLFKILHFSCFEIGRDNLARIAMHINASHDRLRWAQVIESLETLKQIGVTEPEKITQVAETLDNWITYMHDVTLQVLFEQILNESGLLKFIMHHPEKSWFLQAVNTFFNFIKDETAKDPSIHLEHVLSMLDKMEENKIPIAINKIISSENGVRFITAHSAKGLEFEHVYMLGSTRNIWDSNRKNTMQYPYPDNVNADVKTNEQDERRLFYVAMTRAKSHLEISFSMISENSKELGPCRFVDELTSHPDLEKESISTSEEIRQDFYSQYFTLTPQEVPLIERDLIDAYLENYRLSVTHLNKYLLCPLTFYFESILRVPTARNAATGFGNAVHHALEFFFRDMNEDKNQPAEVLLRKFKSGMKKYKSHFTPEEYESYRKYGMRILEAYYNKKIEKWKKADQYVLEARLIHGEYQGVPLKGMLDRVDVFKNYVHVVDYKTGNYIRSKNKMNPPNDYNPNGGDYWRQITFYKMLVDSDTKYDWNLGSAEMDFVEPDKKTDQFYSKQFSVSPSDLAIVGEQIVNTYRKIKNYEFNKTCDNPKCYWCNFVKNDFMLDGELERDEDVYESLEV